MPSTFTVLILFILLVIVLTVILVNEENDSPADGSFEIAEALRFEIYNDTGTYSLYRTSFTGSTGSPVPGQTVQPYTRSILRVNRTLFKETRAQASFSVVNLGANFSCTMIVTDNGDAFFSSVIPKTGPITVSQSFSGELPILTVRRS
ncbi:hypothetical protein M3223_01690 [Paenibacillus pasadenensis]|uniref:hypothetical protein n=1 Tax=Paenibacillus pasadenensis TaxID=217090 RepID=UPI00204122FB|nr:hypothetical protein [Paenibacillus pasadenensis]MCM3746060.1 hypothetical protein [Paenibacillus pasadenensis]